MSINDLRKWLDEQMDGLHDRYMNAEEEDDEGWECGYLQGRLNAFGEIRDEITRLWRL